MADAAELFLEAVPYVTDNYEKVWDPTKEKSKQGFEAVKRRMSNRQRGFASDSDYDSDDGPRSRSYQNGRRRGRDGEIVETKRVIRTTSAGRDERSYRRSRRYSDSDSSRSPPRRSSSKRRQSLGQKAMAALGLGAAGGAVASSRRRSYSSSRSRSRTRGYDRQRRRSADYYDEGPRVAPSSRGYDDGRTPNRYKPAGYIEGGDRSRGRDSQSLVKRDGNSEAARTKRSSSSSSSVSSSDVCSSSEDERRKKKMVKKEWITAGLAAVATIHAAHGVYSSMEARDKRMLEVMKGEMSPEVARKQKNKARLQDAASIGIAALGIKGAYSEWKEVQEKREEMAEVERERQEHHEKRMKKLEKHGPDYFKRRSTSRGRNTNDSGSRRRSSR